MKQARIQLNITLKEAKVLEQLVADYGVQYGDMIDYKILAHRINKMVNARYNRITLTNEKMGAYKP